MKRGMIVLIFVILAFAIVGGYVYFNSSSSDNNNDDGILCAQDAKQCPDGSYVGRNPDNNCEFFECSSTNQTNNSKYTDKLSYDISIKNFEFTPLTLEINVGDSVTWTNEDIDLHTVTSDYGTELDSEYLSKGEMYSHTFTEAGTYEYHCAPHPYMKGKIIVK